MTSPSILSSLGSGGTSSLLGTTKSKAKAQDDTTTGSTSGTASTSSSGDSSSQTSLTSLGSTFLMLLTQELQNQDPTAPMDSTQMVGQMISLNQLDQLASINQLLTTQFSSTGTATTSGTDPVTSSV